MKNINITPKECFKNMSFTESVMIDVRTIEELKSVGKPNLKDINSDFYHIPLYLMPNMSINMEFENLLKKTLTSKEIPLYFICRSGGRSMQAALIAKEIGFTNSYNVEYGFEGDVDIDGERSKINGWKADNLPWEFEK